MKEGELLSEDISNLIRSVLSGRDISRIAANSKMSSSLLSQVLYHQTGITKKNKVAIYQLLSESLIKAKQKEMEFASKKLEIQALLDKYN